MRFACWKKMDKKTQTLRIRNTKYLLLFLSNNGYANTLHYYEGVSKSPRTMLITRKSLVVHELPARVCCEWVCRVTWLDVEAFDCCTCLYVCIASTVCGFLISAVWRNLTNKGCASSSVWDWVKREVKLLKCWNRLLVIRAWAVAELLSGLDVSGMAELRLLMMIDQVGQARQQPPRKWNRYGRLSTRIVVVPYTISVQRLELVMDLVSEFSQNSWTCIRLQRSLCRECWPRIKKTVE